MNILLSSYDFHEEWAQEIMYPLLRKDMKVIVIPFSFDEKDIQTVKEFDDFYGKKGRFTPDILKPFHFYGLHDIEFIDYFRHTHEYAQEKVKNADVIFLTGGLPDRYFERLNHWGLIPVLKDSQALIIGASAGAMIQLDEYHITPDDDYDHYQYHYGIGWVSGFKLEVHYCHSSIQDEGIERVIREKGLPTYAVANDGGLYVHRQQVMPFGRAFLVNQ